MICSPATAMLELFNQAKDTLTDEKLKWLSGLSVVAECEASNLAANLGTLAIVVGSTVEPDPEVIQRILWGLENQAAITAAMIEVSGHAKDLLQIKYDNASAGGAQ